MNESLQEVINTVAAGERARISGLSVLGIRLMRTGSLLLVLMLLFLFAVGYGYHLGWKHRGNSDAAAQLMVEENNRAELQAQIKRNAKISADYEAEKAKQKIVYRTIREEVPRVVTQYVERPGAPAVPVPAWVVTHGFVRLWNAGLVGDLHAAAGGAAGTAATADPADDQRVGVDAAAILANHIDNAEQYKDCRTQLQTLIDWHTQRR